MINSMMDIFRASHMAIEANFRAQYGPGRVFQWRTGKFEGRQCVVTEMRWEYRVNYWTLKNRNEPVFMVWVLLKTANKKGDGWLDESSAFSRTYQLMTPEDFAIVFTPKGLK